MDKQTLKRLRMMLVAVIGIFVLLSSRLAYMQVVQHEEYRRRAEDNIFRKLPVVAHRGGIYDRYGTQLVTNRPGFSVSLIDLGSGYDPETVSFLSEILGIAESEVWENIRAQRFRRYLPVLLQNDVPFDIIAKIAERRTALAGVLIEAQPIRHYVKGNFAPHILGHTGEVDDMCEQIIERWAAKGFEYRSGDVVGRDGIERVWEPYLRGRDGKQRVEINVIGQITGHHEKIDPLPGADLYLTIDAKLQKETENILSEVVARLRDEENDERNEHVERAAAVAIDPRSGAILAMASYPGFNPNTFSEDFRELEADPRDILVNYAISGTYPPGSVFKMVVGAAALEENLLGPEERFRDAGSITRFNQTVSNFGGRAFGRIDVVRALQVSSNVFFAEMGARLGIDTLAEYGKKFGFGTATGLRDIPGEEAGNIASREAKARATDEPWMAAETLIAAIGQGYHDITPLQLANHIAMFANEGVHFRPHLIKKIVDHEGNITKTEPEVLREIELTPQTWDVIQEGMRQVMKPGGTAWHLFRDFPVEIAGKTGTAQVVPIDACVQFPPHSLFVAYAPFEEPEIAIAVIVEHGERGSVAALPVAYAILSAYFGVEDPGEVIYETGSSMMEE